VGGSFFVTLGLVFAVVSFLESKVGQQPVKVWLVRSVEFSGLFGSRARRKYFINNLLKTDCQHGANLFQGLFCVYSGLFTFCGMLSAT
ncbi:hypothetical protein OPW36_13005, partial [Vibrio europaeus]|nr:hypothetical protein [Vibrio europaeus]MDC5812515.1 hypothetical protein [Vibrio europaeus]MDC5825629.1 hypothetical protein [Vibrio europaeus]MDC5831091.1 hypothetical protein [Vibrio europaeus]MDC5834047.1 hypothetical protein [Vibrio europaeus]